MKGFHLKKWRNGTIKIIVISSWTEDQKKIAILETKLKLALSSLEDILKFNHWTPEYANKVKKESLNTIYKICHEELEIQEVSISSE